MLNCTVSHPGENPHETAGLEAICILHLLKRLKKYAFQIFVVVLHSCFRLLKKKSLHGLFFTLFVFFRTLRSFVALDYQEVCLSKRSIRNLAKTSMKLKMICKYSLFIISNDNYFQLIDNYFEVRRKYVG